MTWKKGSEKSVPVYTEKKGLQTKRADFYDKMRVEEISSNVEGNVLNCRY